MTNIQFVMQNRKRFPMGDVEFFSMIEKMQRDHRLTVSIVNAIQENNDPVTTEIVEKKCPKCDRKALDAQYKKSS